MKNCSQYITEAKTALGNPYMSDKELGERFGCSQQNIAAAKKKMSDRVALKIGQILQAHGLIEHAGEVLLVAHAERDADPHVRAALMEYAGKVVSLTAKNAESVRELVGAVGSGLKGVAALAIVAGASALPAHDAQAQPSNAAGSSVCYVNLPSK